MDAYDKRVLQVPANNAADILDQVYVHKTWEEELDSEGNPRMEGWLPFMKHSAGKWKEIEVNNLTEYQKEIKKHLGVGPWCELSDEELHVEPWTYANPEKPDHAYFPQKEGDYFYYQLEHAKMALQKSRLRVMNARLLGLNPGILEALQPSSNSISQHRLLSSDLLQYFEENVPNLQKRDLAEILKWGKWRTFYRPGTEIQRQG